MLSPLDTGLVRQAIWRTALVVLGLCALIAGCVMAAIALHIWLADLYGPLRAAGGMALGSILLAALLFWIAVGRGSSARATAPDQPTPSVDDERAAQVMESYLVGKRIGERLGARH